MNGHGWYSAEVAGDKIGFISLELWSLGQAERGTLTFIVEFSDGSKP